MRFLTAAIVFLLPVVILPGWSFYYDVTPKAVVLLGGLAVLLAYASTRPALIPNVWTTPFARWNTIMGLSFAAITAISAFASPYVSLAWNGSSWRGSGGIVLIATVVLAMLSAAWAGTRNILLALCAAGVPIGLYAIAQYFGWDPWLPGSAYHFGESVYEIVRPPGTLGHANYLAAFLIWPIFAGLAVYREHRVLGASASIIGLAAIVLSGSRGALLGLAAGIVVLLWTLRPRLSVVASGAAIFAAIACAFYFSPAGAHLRARAFWITEDSAGGARSLLWRDSLRMSSQRPWTGFGPETFAAVFPQHQSAELSRAYPEFYHESPHNMFLDALLSQGFSGPLLLLAWLALGCIAARRTKSHPALLAALTAAVVTHQFAVFIIPTFFLFVLTISLVCAGKENIPRRVAGTPLRWACAAGAVLLSIPAWQLIRTDHERALAQRLLEAGRFAEAASLSPSEGPAGIYFSRRWAEAAAKAPDTISKLRYAQLALDNASAATRSPEQRPNAWYNLAMLYATSEDLPRVEACLRNAITSSPAWYKPHWALARLLHLTGRSDEARKEAALAADLNGRRDPEVIATAQEILRSGHSAR